MWQNDAKFNLSSYVYIGDVFLGASVRTKKNSDTDRVNIDLHAGTPHLHMKPHQWPAHMESTKRTVVPRYFCRS